MDLDIDDATRALLERYGFDSQRFEQLRQRFIDGELRPGRSRIEGRVETPAESDLVPIPPRGSSEREALAQRGREALRAGQVGCVILAGGMATRFGGVVKANVEALAGLTFLELKLRDLEVSASREGAELSALLMTSFATDEEIGRAVRARRYPGVRVETFPQFVSLRLDPQGQLFRDVEGAPSLYAPGHGDLCDALRSSGALVRFRDAGGRVLTMSNVDNLGATLDAAVIGAHLESGVALTAEVVAKNLGDAGGAPARVEGTLQIVESFRFPEGFDQDRIPVFNTNSFVLDAEALDREFPLSWFAVSKKVDGREAVQFERLAGELSAFLPSATLVVERDGEDGRFQPVKDPADLERRRPAIEALLRARGVV